MTFWLKQKIVMEQVRMVRVVVQISTSWYFAPGIAPGISRILQTRDFPSKMASS
jgi:hypothetical protein